MKIHEVKRLFDSKGLWIGEKYLNYLVLMFIEQYEKCLYHFNRIW